MNATAFQKITELIKLKLKSDGPSPTVTPSKLWHIAFQVTAFSCVEESSHADTAASQHGGTEAANKETGGLRFRRISQSC